ncbi:MAG: cysteine hydrolase [Planctomycetota bacterium]
MIRSIIRLRPRRILVDVDTQRDFLLAEGLVCVRNHRRVLANIRRVTAWARYNNIRIISTAQVYPENNGRKEHFCIDGTAGQRKISYTIRNNHISFVADGNTDLPRDILRSYDQVIFNKRSFDPFAEPRLDRLLSELRVDEVILMGVCTEDAIKATVLGLLHRGKKVTVVSDAVGSRNKSEGNLALRQMQAKGAKLIEAKALAGVSGLRVVGVCRCNRCRGLMRKEVVSTSIVN